MGKVIGVLFIVLLLAMLAVHVALSTGLRMPSEAMMGFAILGVAAAGSFLAYVAVGMFMTHDI